MPEPTTSINTDQKNKRIFSLEEWVNMELTAKDTEAVIGIPGNVVVGPQTRNLIVAPEKSFKTTFLLRLMTGLSMGTTVFPGLDVPRAQSVLYLHGELNKGEIQSRIKAAIKGLSGPLGNMWEGRIFDAHLIDEHGQKTLQDALEVYKPENLVLDPWQAFIAGNDENVFSQMSIAQSFCNDLIDKYGLTIWIAMHTGKDPSKGPRGHSSINGWRDTEIQLKRTNNTLRIKVDARWGTSPEPFTLVFDENTLHSSKDPHMTGQTARIRGFVESSGLPYVTRDQLGEHLGLPKEALRKALERARDAGVINIEGNLVMLPIEDIQSEGLVQ
jgi:hypothetical protein